MFDLITLSASGFWTLNSSWPFLQEVVELAGYTQRVSIMMDVFHDCANSRWACERESQKSWCRYKRAAVSQVAGIKILDGAPVIEGKVSAEKSSIQMCFFLGRYVVNQVQVQQQFRWRIRWVGSSCWTTCRSWLPTVTLWCRVFHSRWLWRLAIMIMMW